MQLGQRVPHGVLGDADLDSLSPDWEVGGSWVDGTDLYLDSSGSAFRSQNGVNFALVSGPPDYATCQNATAYYGSFRLDKDGNSFSTCARTNDRRFAFVTIVDQNVPVALDITIWDPPRR